MFQSLANSNLESREIKLVKPKNQDRHHDKCYYQNHYREKELKMVIEKSGLGH